MLADAPDLVSCAQRCCDHLVAHGYELPSLYMRRSGRLRRFASNGYWQVLDGFPEASGVIAATVRTGRPHLIEVATSAEYLKAAPNVAAEACVPVRLYGEVAGGLNVESSTPFTGEVLTELEAVAACFAERVEQLGGMPAPSGWVLLADNAARIARTEDRDEMLETALSVATTLSGSPSGLVALREAGEHVVTHTVGPLEASLQHLGAGSLAEIAVWVDGPLSCYTVGEPEGQGFTGDDSLRVAGIHSLIVVALAAADERLGFWQVRTRYMEELHSLSRRDPLTGLGHQRAFQDRIDQLARGGFAGSALLSVDVDHFKAVNDAGGHQAGDRLLRDLANVMAKELRGGDDLFRVGGDEFAAVLVGISDGDQAFEVAERVRLAAHRTGSSVSIGIATSLGEDLDCDELFRRADAALYRAKGSGRDASVLWEPPLPASTDSRLATR